MYEIIKVIKKQISKILLIKINKLFFLQIIFICTLLGNWDPYKRYKGTTIVVSWPSLNHFNKAKVLVKEFERETGINVEIDSLQYLRLHDKQVLEMSKRKGEYDVVAWVVMWKGEYVKKGLLTPLSQFFVDFRLQDMNYDIEDIIEPYLVTGGIVGGRKGYLKGKTAALYGIPFGAETSILLYRKDIFKRYRLEVPKTYDEMLKVAKVIKGRVPNMSGMAMRGASGHQITHTFLLHLSPFGGKIFDNRWNPIFHLNEGIKAAKYLKEIAKQGPIGIASYGFSESVNAFLQGETGMYLDTLKAAAMARDERLSKIKGKVGYALHPVAKICGAQTGGFAMGIPNNSMKKQAAFLFIQWMTNKRNDKRLAHLGGDPIRDSTLADLSLSKKYPEYKIIRKQLKCANTDWRPLISEWGEINVKILGKSLSEILIGSKEIKPALKEAAEKTKLLMERSGYYR